MKVSTSIRVVSASRRTWVQAQESGFGPHLVEDTERHDAFGHAQTGLCKPQT
jgi:hypothetical protein